MLKTKTTFLLTALTAFFFTVALCQFPTALHAQQMRHSAPDNHGQTEQAPNTFNGTVMQFKDGRIALITGKDSHGQLQGHFLDDPKAAKRFLGQEVVVEGRLDTATNTIHVTKITPP